MNPDDFDEWKDSVEIDLENINERINSIGEDIVFIIDMLIMMSENFGLKISKKTKQFEEGDE